MSLESRLQAAKQEKLLTQAPILRRVLLRSRWFGTIGAVSAVIQLTREVVAATEVGFEPEGVLSWAGVAIAGVLTILMVWVANRTVAAAAKYDFDAVASWLGKMRLLWLAVAIFGVLVLLGSVIFLASSGAEVLSEAAVPLLIMVVTLLLGPYYLWEVRRASREVQSIQAGVPLSGSDGEAVSRPDSASAPSASPGPRPSTNTLLGVYIVAICGLTSLWLLRGWLLGDDIESDLFRRSRFALSGLAVLVSSFTVVLTFFVRPIALRVIAMLLALTDSGNSIYWFVSALRD